MRILLVDDSRIFRGVLESVLAKRADVVVAGSVWNGEKALEFIRRTPPDLVTLDINMPGCGGLATLSAIQQFNAEHPDQPAVGVILVSALTKKGAAVTVDGLERGAFDFIPKPDGPSEAENETLLQRQLFEKIDLFIRRKGRRLYLPSGGPTEHRPRSRHPTGRYQAVVIGSSTGGPEALSKLLPPLTKKISVPVFIVQHMPAGMTTYFAASLAKSCEYRVIEAADGDVVQDRTAYVAPGGRHLLLRRSGGRIITALNDQPPENHCRPSVDVLFRSAAVVYDQALVAVVLTGMGSDGAQGLGALKRSGAYVIAQDEATSVVWGMPGAAVATNHVDETLPLGQIAPAISTLLGQG